MKLKLFSYFLPTFLFLVFVCGSLPISCLALSLNSYQDLNSTNSTAINLVNAANQYQSFQNADFVIVQNEQYSYYIVWGKDFTYASDSVTGGSCEYVRYYRTDSSGYNNNYDYVYGTDTSVYVLADEMVVSNIDGLGFSSLAYEQLQTYKNINNLLIFVVAILFVVMLRNLRRV